jgi:hypothetical protein
MTVVSTYSTVESLVVFGTKHLSITGNIFYKKKNKNNTAQIVLHTVFIS